MEVVSLLFLLVCLVTAQAVDLSDEKKVEEIFAKMDPKKVKGSAVDATHLKIPLDQVPDWAKKEAKEGRIINGAAAAPRQFPYQVMLMALSSVIQVEFSMCGGSLISRNYVLTAAHCLKGVTAVQVMLGKHKSYALLQKEQGAISYIQLKSSLIVHPGYDSVNNRQDIALIKLKSPAPLSDQIQTIDLPRSHNNYDKRMLTVSGWGAIDSKGNEPKELQHTKLRIMPQATCIHWWSNIDSTHICAHSTTKESSCQGDSGGPLVTYENGRPILAGVVSFGPEDCRTDEGYPNVLTRVSSYLDWIRANSDVQLPDSNDNSASIFEKVKPKPKSK